MLRWSSSRSVSAMVMLGLLLQLTVSESAARQNGGQGAEAFQYQSQVSATGAVAESSTATTSTYNTGQSNQLPASQPVAGPDRRYSANHRTPHNSDPGQFRRSIPQRLVPPGRHQNSNVAFPQQGIAGTSATGSAATSIPDTFTDSGTSGRPAFPLPPIVKPSDLVGTNRPVQPAVTDDIRSRPADANSPDPSQPAAKIVAIQVPPAAPAGHTKQRFNSPVYRDQMVTRASIMVATGEGGTPDGGSVQQTVSNDRGRYVDDPFQDPAPDDTEPRPDPFAEPPEDLLPQNRQQNPFADPPEDMDPSRVQDPFRDPEPQPQIDPFANTPDDIQPPTEFRLPQNGLPTDESSVLEVEQPEIVIKPPRQILGPFEQPGFQPEPLLEAPEYREFSQYAQPPQYVPVPTTEYQHGMPRYPEELQYPIDPYPPQSLVGQPDADQPTLAVNDNTGFQKRDLYRGITNQVEGKAFPAYECAPCNSNLIGQGSAGCLLGCQSNTGCCSPTADGLGCGCGGQYFDNCCQPMFYVSVLGGYTGLQDSSPLLLQGSEFRSQGSVNYNDGFGVGMALGQFQGDNLRTEIEFSYRYNGTGSLQASGFDLPLDGSVESFSGMFNLVWDFRPQPVFGCVRPYLGGGVGFAFVDVNLSNRSVPVVSDEFRSDSSFAWQLMAGLSRQLTCSIDGFVEYRYFSAESVRLNLEFPTAAAGDVGYDTNNVFFGFRTRF